MAQITVTKEGLEKLQQEYNYLKNVKRKEVTEAIKIAKGFGDLSENSEYDEAKSEQSKVESRIVELEAMLKNAVLISDEDIKTNVVGVGSHVKLYDETFEEEVEYSIVGSTEADPLHGRISDVSPIGKAIIGHKKGDKVVVETPNGHINMNVLEISRM